MTEKAGTELQELTVVGEIGYSCSDSRRQQWKGTQGRNSVREFAGSLDV